ncbi:hypothetical protein BT63DRAFT_293774 [Microthyrium microscopicum]|uniref:Uncharacterized protein n=1 Tax=Microthyrium microscopicum TaxID=703497 RepID=A0A6A6U871_9PEZI|nr:hypothetical protein BT63DRAFT_293774 [Microthyrium microscopicum]
MSFAKRLRDALRSVHAESAAPERRPTSVPSPTYSINVDISVSSSSSRRSVPRSPTGSLRDTFEAPENPTRTIISYARPVTTISRYAGEDPVLSGQIRQFREASKCQIKRERNFTLGGEERKISLGGNKALMTRPSLKKYSEDVADRNISPGLAQIQEAPMANQQRKAPHGILVNSGMYRFNEDVADRNISSSSKPSWMNNKSGEDEVANWDRRLSTASTASGLGLPDTAAMFEPLYAFESRDQNSTGLSLGSKASVPNSDGSSAHPSNNRSNSGNATPKWQQGSMHSSQSGGQRNLNINSQTAMPNLQHESTSSTATSRATRVFWCTPSNTSNATDPQQFARRASQPAVLASGSSSKKLSGSLGSSGFAEKRRASPPLISHRSYFSKSSDGSGQSTSQNTIGRLSAFRSAYSGSPPDTPSTVVRSGLFLDHQDHGASDMVDTIIEGERYTITRRRSSTDLASLKPLHSFTMDIPHHRLQGQDAVPQQAWTVAATPVSSRTPVSSPMPVSSPEECAMLYASDTGAHRARSPAPQQPLLIAQSGSSSVSGAPLTPLALSSLQMTEMSARVEA